MPFPDEISTTGIRVVDFDPRWATEFRSTASQLSEVLGAIVRNIDHVGSTSIPGMAAKDCIDVQVRVNTTYDPEIERRMIAFGFRRRPERWNQLETSFEVVTEKQVYAPPAGARPVNIHIRPAEGASARYALLFRDYLRSNPAVRDAWGAFKLLLAQSVNDIHEYGQIKQPATTVLMEGAQKWAEQTRWAPPQE